jgi:hypothetical protein
MTLTERIAATVEKPAEAGRRGGAGDSETPGRYRHILVPRGASRPAWL